MQYQECKLLKLLKFLLYKKRNLDQKINDPRPHNFRFSNTKSQSQLKLERRPFILQYAFTQKTSLILQTSSHSILLKIYSRNITKNPLTL